MICESIITLLKEVPCNANNLAPYNEKLLKEIYHDMQQMFQENENEAGDSLIEEHLDSLTTLLTRHAMLERNSRGLVNYHFHRLMYIKGCRWAFGVVLPSNLKQNVIQYENKWFIKYNNNFYKFLLKSGYHELGFQMIHSKKPPKSLYIQVRCLKDYANYENENGQILNFTKNSQHYLPKAQCEHLIEEGILEHLLST